MKIRFWCEFPKKVSFSKLNRILERLDMHIEIYVAAESKKEFTDLRKKIKSASKHITVHAWPILPKKKGYWFSGYTDMRDIDQLRKFKGENFKIDLEPPFKGKYSNLKMIPYILKPIFKKAPNTEYLQNTIKDLAVESNIIINEFPMPKFWLKRAGVYYDGKDVTKNLMAYTSIPGFPLNYFLILENILFNWMKKKEYKSCSVGIIGPGILKRERYYCYPREFKLDMKIARWSGFEQVVIYSIEAIMKKKKPEEWLKIAKRFY